MQQRLRLQLARLGVALVSVGCVTGALPAAASAHAFLIRSTPAAGSRLATSPHEIALYFSEPFVGLSEQVTLRRADGTNVALQRPTGHGAVVEQPLPSGLRGVFVVSWQVLTDEGHISLGQFAFSAGSAAALPAVRSRSGRGPWSELLASWLVFAGLALALGGIASERFIWRLLPSREDVVAGAPVGIGLAVAAVGALLQLVLLAGARASGGFSAGLHGTALSDAFATRPGKLTLAMLVALAAGGIVVRFRLLRSAPLVPLVAAIAFNSARGHSGTTGKTWPVVADTIHLTAAAFWIGALVHVVIVVARASEREAMLTVGVRRYARVALPTVVVVLASGAVTALPEFANVHDVVSTRYGHILIVKAALIATVLSLATLGRLLALAGNPHPRIPLLRRLTRFEAAGLGAVLVAVAFLVNGAPPRISAASASATLGASPVEGRALRLAELAGQLVVGMAATERELQFTVVPPSDQIRDSVSLTGRARLPDGRDVDLDTSRCGSDCFSLPFRPPAGTTRITVNVSSHAWTGGQARFAVRAPLAREQPAIVQRITAAMRGVAHARSARSRDERPRQQATSDRLPTERARVRTRRKRLPAAR